MSKVGGRLRVGHLLHKYLLNSSTIEDIIQSKYLAHLEGRCLHQNDTQFTIDYLRKRSGRKGSRHYEQRVQLNYLNHTHGGDNSVDNFTVQQLQQQELYNPTIELQIDLRQLLSNFTSQEQELIILNYIYEYTNEELMHLFRVSEYHLKTTKRQIHKRLKQLMLRLGYGTQR